LNRSANSFKPNISLYGPYLALVLSGWLMLFSIGYNEVGYSLNTFFSTALGKQTIWIGISLFAFIALQFVDWKFWQTIAIPIYGISLALLVGVFIFGTNINGATSWYRIGSVTIQPSEFAKIGTALAVASYLNNYSTDLRKWQSISTLALIILVPMLLILLQPDAGSAIIFTSFLLVMYRAGFSPQFYIISFFGMTMLILGLMYPATNVTLALSLIGVGLLIYYTQPKFYLAVLYIVFIIASYEVFKLYPQYHLYQLLTSIGVLSFLAGIVWNKKKKREVSLVLMAIFLGSLVSGGANWGFNHILKSHQQQRINVWLHPELVQNKDAGYNLEKSKLAIGAGGFSGKGFLQGDMTKGNFVPEQTTDFIFCTVGEEQGFVGTVLIIGLFLYLLVQIVIVAERQRSKFAMYYGYSVAGILFLHLFINIGMTMGLAPIIGVPLPFLSKGGSSLLGFSILLGILVNMDSRRY